MKLGSLSVVVLGLTSSLVACGDDAGSSGSGGSGGTGSTSSTTSASTTGSSAGGSGQGGASQGGGAQGGAAPVECVENADCDDNDLCTVEACTDGVCVTAPGMRPDDGDACTENDTCDPATGMVSGTPINFDDGIACTVDSCDPQTGPSNMPQNCASYATVKPLFQQFCNGCHTTQGNGGTNFAASHADTQLPSGYCTGKTMGECALVRINDGSMPQGLDCSNTFVGACPTQAQRATIQKWITDGQQP
jgi:hypothetical protein